MNPLSCTNVDFADIPNCSSGHNLGPMCGARNVLGRYVSTVVIRVISPASVIAVLLICLTPRVHLILETTATMELFLQNIRWALLGVHYQLESGCFLVHYRPLAQLSFVDSDHLLCTLMIWDTLLPRRKIDVRRPRGTISSRLQMHPSWQICNDLWKYCLEHD